MDPQVPLTRDLVFIGGGHAHALVLRRWGMAPLPGARLTVIDPNPKAPYTGMLPGFVAGHYTRDALDIDLVRLARFAGARLVQGRAVGLDPSTRRVHVAGRPDIAYDVLSIDIGITSHMSEVPGFADHAIAAKPLGPFADRWHAFLTKATDGDLPPEVAVIGGGVAGVELALAMHHRLAGLSRTPPRVRVLEAGAPLQGTAAGTRRALERAMRRRGIEMVTGAGVAEVTPGAVCLTDGREIPAALTVGAAGARPWPWLADTGLPLHEGFIKVDDTLRVEGTPEIHAAGDCAHLTHAPRPKAGVYAVRAAPVLYQNLRAALAGHTPRRFRPQRDFLKLVSMGGRQAVADKGGLGVHLPGLWHWKDRIDRRFMDRFRALPEMPAPTLPREAAQGVQAELEGHAVICGGCGAKVGPGALAETLDGLAAPRRADVLSRPGDDAGVLVIGGQRQLLSTDHLRAFSEDPWMMARIAAVHALGDVWAMGAAPQAALLNIVLPRMTERLQRRTLREIMAGAEGVMADAGAEIIGGHTTQGAETTIGVTVTGMAEADPIGLDGARPGDALILTKPLGTGVILAAEMATRADGDTVVAAFGSMARPLAIDAAQLRGAHAMTDVTGFGLAGHLLAICRASGCGAELSLDALPLLPGAARLLAAGERASLHAANAAHVAPHLSGGDDGDPARRAALFDPQTAGGLLAAVAPGQAEAALAGLCAQDLPAVRIGTVTEGGGIVLV
ncbi:selenide, water dikinase SelD [Roseovarius salinarum]|uniref:selenide, water dikinase SelD n=1 Tax=Roseovarius salinarum TaxID=1981892 RepID=UPI000C3244F3|nr:selenide, water dikinase SelD [Roseovarius salinarum]